jgi:hypothetical protein
MKMTVNGCSFITCFQSRIEYYMIVSVYIMSSSIHFCEVFMKCVNCDKLTDNPKFCSRSCGISYNNRIKPKRIKSIKKCIFCKQDYPNSKKNQKF